MAGRVRVWLGTDRDLQHLTAPPGNDTVHEWNGTTLCGVEGPLRWVPPEHVDTGRVCGPCSVPEGYEPAMDGEGWGPP